MEVLNREYVADLREDLSSACRKAWLEDARGSESASMDLPPVGGTPLASVREALLADQLKDPFRRVSSARRGGSQIRVWVGSERPAQEATARPGAS